ncbi:MAG: hypothetical protein CI947_2527 [Halanaerobium sp.]|jgi:hypothetical protein|nr:MAG: hypothetical protein CI947_2527 [Halanaerobium sp.]
MNNYSIEIIKSIKDDLKSLKHQKEELKFLKNRDCSSLSPDSTSYTFYQV